MSLPENETEQPLLLGTSAAARECARLGRPLSEAGLKRASDRGELRAIRTVGRGMRLFRLDDVQAFARARL